MPDRIVPSDLGIREISFNQINKKTGPRIRYLKVDADTGEEVPNEGIIKGYQVDKDRYLEVTKDELENIALELTEPSRSTSSCRARRSMICISFALTTSFRTGRLAAMPMP